MRVGLDRLAEEAEVQALLRGARLALLAHPASVTRALAHVSDVLEALGARPAVVFGPEHGYGGEAQDMIGVDDARDRRGIPVRSLYGARFEDLSPRAADLDGVDALVVDLQDVGARYYTFVWTAVLAARACAARGVRVVVLDRPNPLGGDLGALEGRLPEPPYLSFVGLEPLPVRHALTLGEIVAWRARAEGLPKDALAVVRVRGLERDAAAPAWDRPFVPPSPNMPTYETARVYPGGCLVEGTNLSEGRGTTRPFELVGAPWIDGYRLARDLEELGLSGVRFRPVTFQPTFHKHSGVPCGGVQVHADQGPSLRAYGAYLALVALARAQDPERFRFRSEAYEFRDDVPAFDLLTGSPRARELVQAGAPPAAILEEVARPRPADLEHVRAAAACVDAYAR